MGRNARCKHCGNKFLLAASGEGGLLRPAVPTQLPAAAKHTVASEESALALPAADGAIPPRPSATTGQPVSIGRFEIRSELGAGAFGTVYRAHDPQLDREIALKVPRAGLLDSPKKIERFLREAKSAGKLHHPHIVPIYEAGRAGEQCYIASAFIAGQTLAGTIERKRPDFGVGGAGARLAEALAYAHEQGIVHRDVKPANVMVDDKGHAHLMDFGLAHRDDLAEKLTQDGTVMGTPAYIAPEQAEGAKGEALPASDQYSLGVLLYELLCGRTPFEGAPSLQVLLFHVIHREPEAPRQVQPRVPRDLETVCLKALAKRPADRYASCQEMADDLRRWLADEPIEARRLRPAERVLRWCRRNPLVSSLTLVVAVLLVLVAGVSTAMAIRVSVARSNAEAALAQAEQAQEQTETARQQAADRAHAAEAANRSEAEARRNVEAALAKAEQATKAEGAAKLREEKQRLQTDAALAKAETNRFAYLHRIALAQVVIKAGQWNQAPQLLDECPVGLRHWEWHFLRWGGSPELSTFRSHLGSNGTVAISPDGKTLASAGHNRVGTTIPTRGHQALGCGHGERAHHTHGTQGPG